MLVAVFVSALAPSLAWSLQLSDSARVQVQRLFAEKDRLTATQRRVAFRLLLAEREARGERLSGLPSLQSDVVLDARGRALVDIDARVSTFLLRRIERMGGEIVHASERYDRVRAKLPVRRVEAVAELAGVRFIGPAIGAVTNSGLANAINVSEGDIAHAADTARAQFGVDGSGVKACILSDGVNSLASLQASGDLPAGVTVLPGQAGNGDEGSAMLEIVHDLAPGADLYFATAFTSDASFADNIRSLRFDYGCDVIADDIFYFNESPFQDGPAIAPAVNDVTADGALYFSSAGNSGNVNDGTAGVWEGDFVDGGAGPNGQARIHDFGGGRGTNEVTKAAPYAVVLHWSDPLGASGNDYELLVLDPTRQNVVSASLNTQDGNDNPFEIVGSVPKGYFLLIAKRNGAAGRYLHLNSIRGELEFVTDGQTGGHPSAKNAFSVAAVRAQGATVPFDGSESIETFSSDGPRRVFYQEDGTLITPGNVSSTGGEVRQDPDITAADGVHVAAPGFDPFFGTSAAAPHAAGIAALVLSADPTLDIAGVRSIFESTALDIEAPGVDRDSGHGIVMADRAVRAASLRTRFDFDGDGATDVLWRKPSVGTSWFHFMDGLSVSSEGAGPYVAPDWTIAGVGDFNGDRKSDLFWRRANGVTWFYLMDGAAVASDAAGPWVDLSYSVAGTGDLDGNGTDDIVWRRSNGATWIYLVSGTSITSQGAGNTVGLDWKLEAIRDFDGDGKADIFWRRNNGSTWFYFMNGLTVANEAGGPFVGTDWDVAGTGDLDGDGKEDIVWRRPSNGALWYYLMDGASIKAQGAGPVVGLDWVLAAIRDLDGDGKDDLYWRRSNGANWIYLMDGMSIDSEGAGPFVATDWSAIDP